MTVGDLQPKFSCHGILSVGFGQFEGTFHVPAVRKRIQTVIDPFVPVVFIHEVEDPEPGVEIDVLEWILFRDEEPQHLGRRYPQHLHPGDHNPGG